MTDEERRRLEYMYAEKPTSWGQVYAAIRAGRTVLANRVPGDFSTTGRLWLGLSISGPDIAVFENGFAPGRLHANQVHIEK